MDTDAMDMRTLVRHNPYAVLNCMTKGALMHLETREKVMRHFDPPTPRPSPNHVWMFTTQTWYNVLKKDD